MNTIFNPIRFIEGFSALGERQGPQERLAARRIKKVLLRMGASFYLQRFATKIPEVRRQRLLADGRIIPCVATSFVSGRIESNYQLLSSLISSQKFLYEPNINFNPRSRGISRSNHYFAPSVAVARAAVPKLLRAKKSPGRGGGTAPYPHFRKHSSRQP
jgi:hypothetical protein